MASLLELPDARVAWLVRREGAAYEFAVAEQADVLHALLPGLAQGRWRVSPTGEVALPAPPFPPTRLALSPRGIAALDAAAAARRWGLLGPCLALAAGLVLGALYVAIEGRRRRATLAQREALLLSATHELKTPIANVRLYAETLQTHGGHDPDAVGRFARIIEEEALRLEERVREMLGVAVGRSAGRATAGCFDPRPVLEGAIAACRHRRPSNDAEIDLKVGDGCVARGTAPLFGRIVETLLDNALKFGGGSRVRVVLRAAGSHVELHVEDEGPGIPAADRKRVLEPFVRLERDVQAGVPGTGLGLALARRCAEACGGRIVLERSRAGGARVRVLLPRAAQPLVKGGSA